MFNMHRQSKHRQLIQRVSQQQHNPNAQFNNQHYQQQTTTVASNASNQTQKQHVGVKHAPDNKPDSGISIPQAITLMSFRIHKLENMLAQGQQFVPDNESNASYSEDMGTVMARIESLEKRVKVSSSTITSDECVELIKKQIVPYMMKFTKEIGALKAMQTRLSASILDLTDTTNSNVNMLKDLDSRFCTLTSSVDVENYSDAGDLDCVVSNPIRSYDYESATATATATPHVVSDMDASDAAEYMPEMAYDPNMMSSSIGDIVVAE